MADGKNSFIFYCDWQATFESLPDDKAGQLIKHLLAYVNDQDPQTDDLLIKAVFAQLKATLKRDLKKYEERTNKKSEGGREGNLKRWHKDLYKQYKKGKISLETAESIALDRKTSHTDDKGSDGIGGIADSVSDSVSVSDNDNKKTPKGVKKARPSLEEFIAYGLEKKPDVDRQALELKYEAWKEAGWINGNGREIKNWKTSLLNTLPHMKTKQKKKLPTDVKML